jgi:hypothetical protein
MVVESGNGRTIGIKKAYLGKNGGKYKKWLSDNAAEFGISEADVKKMRKPVLVRIRTTEVDPVWFADWANKNPSKNIQCKF